MHTITYKLLPILLIAFLNSCLFEDENKDKVNNTKENSINKNDSTLSYFYENRQKINIKNAWKAIETGDSKLYEKVSMDFKLSNNPKELIFFSTIMAIKYDNALAYSDIFFVYYDLYGYGKSKNEKYLRSFLLYNLAKSKELGHRFGNFDFGDTVINFKNIKSSIYYLDDMKVKKNP